MINPYDKCPDLESQNFTLRLVSENDAEDLLICYSDPKAQEFFNIDNFPHDCNFNTIEEMQCCIQFWLMEYSQDAYVRFSIVDKTINKAVGTIEMFGMIGKYKSDPGLLRIDIVSAYEEFEYLIELFALCIDNFYIIFGVSKIATKAISNAVNRLKALQEIGFHAGNFHDRKDYYLRTKSDIL